MTPFVEGVRQWRALTACALLVALCVVQDGASSAYGSRVGPASACRGALSITDPPRDTRSWVIPPRLPEADPLYGDLRRVQLHSSATEVCVRWTTAAPAPAGTTFVFLAGGPYTDVGGAREAGAYGVNLELQKNHTAVATYGLDRVNSNALRVVHVRVGQTGSVVSVLIPISELDRPPANMPRRPPFPYQAFTFEARVITAPDPRGNMRADFWPQEEHIVKTAADINGRLCFPCHDPRFNPFP